MLRTFKFNLGNTLVNCSCVHVSDVTGEGTKAHGSWAQEAVCHRNWIGDQAPDSVSSALPLTAPLPPVVGGGSLATSVLLNYPPSPKRSVLN